LSPQGFYHQTDQRIRSSIRQKRPIQRNAEMEIKTGSHNGAGKFYESYNWVGRGYCWRCGCEGIKCPGTRNQKAYACPNRNPTFHAVHLLPSAPIVSPSLPNSKSFCVVGPSLSTCHSPATNTALHCFTSLKLPSAALYVIECTFLGVFDSHTLPPTALVHVPLTELRTSFEVFCGDEAGRGMACPSVNHDSSYLLNWYKIFLRVITTTHDHGVTTVNNSFSCA
jgi:hypothetical protein